MQPLPMSQVSKHIAGVLLLTVVAIEVGGYVLTRVASGKEELTEFQVAFARAGHAHAGVLVILSLVCLILADAAGIRGLLGYVARLAIPAAAVLMSAGFFLSSAGEGRTERSSGSAPPRSRSAWSASGSPCSAARAAQRNRLPPACGLTAADAPLPAGSPSLPSVHPGSDP